MAYQLIYTSVRRGLIPGRSGYTVAARHRQIRERAVAELERFSGYTFAKSGTSPVVYAHRKLAVSGADYHILTRIVDAGSDYTGRTNHLAHHLICEASELAGCRATPADVLHGFQWRVSYDEEPRYFEDDEIIDLGAYAGQFALPAQHWQGLRGAAGDAALLIDGKGKASSAIVVAPGGEDAGAHQLLALFGESLQLLGHGKSRGATPWDVTFSTYLQQGDSLADFDWVACDVDNVILQRPGRRRILDLSNLGEPTPKTELATMAITARAPVPPPPPAPKSSPAPKPDIARKTGFEATQQEAPKPSPSSGQKPAPSKPAPEQSTPTASAPSHDRARPSPVPAGQSAPSFWVENLRLVLISAAAVLLVAGLTLFFLLGVRPWQGLKSEVRGHLDQGAFTTANALLDQKAAARPRWAERIDKFRKSAVLGEMVLAAEREINGFENAADIDSAEVARGAAALQVDGLEDFASNYFSGAGSDYIRLLVERFKDLESAHSARVRLAAASPRPPPDPAGDPTRDPPPAANPRRTPDEPVEPAGDRVAGPGSVYLFLNGGLSSLSIPESLPKLVRGAPGAKQVQLKHLPMTADRFPPQPVAGVPPFAYKFPETAEEEARPLLPVGGGINVELKFQGGVTTRLVKVATQAGATAADIWSPAASHVLAFGEAAEGFQVLLWNGRPLRSVAALFNPSQGAVVAKPAFAEFIAAIKGGQPARSAPRAVLLRFEPPASNFEAPTPIESSRLKLPLDDKAALKLDFGAITAQRTAAVAEIQAKIDRLNRTIGSGREYMEWKQALDPLEAGLRTTATRLLGPGHDVLIRYRSILDHADPKRARREVYNFSGDLLSYFNGKLRKEGVDRDDIEKINDELSGLHFLNKWEQSEIGSASGVEFAEFMAEFAEECRDLAAKRVSKRSGTSGLTSSYNWIGSRTARQELDELADIWEEGFGGEVGERLWDFAGQPRPELPRNMKQIEQAGAELPGLIARKAEAVRALATLTPLDADGLPPGRYEVCLVFEDGEPRPFIVSEVGQQRAD